MVTRDLSQMLDLCKARLFSWLTPFVAETKAKSPVVNG